MVSNFTRMSLNIATKSSALGTVSSPDNPFFLALSLVDMVTVGKTANLILDVTGRDRIIRPYALPSA
jgi:hypothetical protein